MDIKLIAGLLAGLIGVLTLIAGVVGLWAAAASHHFPTATSQPIAVDAYDARPLWLALSLLLLTVCAIVATLAALAAFLFGARPDILHPTSALPALIQDLNVPAIFVVLAGCASIVIVARLAGVVLRRVKLAKNDVYFAVSLLVSVSTLLLGHFWR